MNEQLFISLLEQLGEADWQSVIDGKGVLVIDDLYLGIGPVDASNAILCAPDEGTSDAATLKSESIADAVALLNNYYLTHPLTQVGFNHQAQKLFDEYGANAFAAPPGQLPKCTLFVDGGEVVAEIADSPRHRYGVYLELEGSLADAVIGQKVQKWLEQGKAHEDYLGMNVCRYNC